MFILLNLPFKVFVLKKSGAVKLTAHKLITFINHFSPIPI